MPQVPYTHQLANGMTLLAERMPQVRSAAVHFMIPAGAGYDPQESLGLANVLTDLITRGAGSRDSRELSDAFDNLGVDHSEGAGIMNLSLSGSMLGRNLLASLELFADVIRRPHLPEEELEPAQSLVLQDIQALEDEPQRKVMIELRKRFYPSPLNRDQRGTTEGVENLTIEGIRTHQERLFRPNGTILSVAGDIDWPSLRDRVEALFGDWQPLERPAMNIGQASPTSEHISKELDQTQIAFAYPSVPMSHPDFYNVRGALGVLSLDMSSRLFMNVREKYGLCYSVYASHESFKDRGAIVGYAGARPEKAQETLERTLHELRTLKNGIEEEELDRVKIGLKSGLIMSQESTGSRARGLASDWYFLNRIRPLQEIQDAINGLTVPEILKYANNHPVSPLTVVTMGPAPLVIPE